MKLLHRDFHIDFMGKKNIFFIISAACLVVIALWGVIFGVDLDISFKGGTIFTYTYSDANADLGRRRPERAGRGSGGGAQAGLGQQHPQPGHLHDQRGDHGGQLH